MASERDVQTFVHRIEEGVWAGPLRFLLLLVCLLALTILFISGFQGLSSAAGMEQAQIARELARGNGFSTKVIRPLAVWEFRSRKGVFPAGAIPDIYHAPLNPFINSLFLRFDRKSWAMSSSLALYPCDVLIAEVSIAFFLLSLAINYFTARHLFGPRLALLGLGLLVVCAAFWEFALSGLPQMLMLFLFSACLYTMARAPHAAVWNARDALWFAAAGALFGLLALAHGLTLWIFAGALLYAGFVVRPRGCYALLMLGTFSLVYAPWLVRNYHVCGNPLGLACFSALGGSPKSENVLMRSLTLLKGGLSPGTLRARIQSQIPFQIDHLYPLLGSSAVAPLFFVSLLHPFKRPEAASFRWRLACMGAGAALGMAVFGLAGEDPQANNLYILFVPSFTFYGLAFVLSIWNRLGINQRIFRTGLICLIYLLSASPLLNTLLQKRGGQLFHWPPYAPPIISLLNKWTSEDEIIVSDMPWAVAWYADRKCLWLPTAVGDFMELNDSRLLGAPLVGLYLTPVSGDAPFLSEIANGEYKGWAPFILGLKNFLPPNFPLHAATRLPLNNECIYYSDRDRWSAAGH